jgi:hypothetical protein
MLQRAQTIIRPPLQNFQNKVNYSAIIIHTKLHNEKLNDQYSSPNIVWLIKSRIMRLVGHVACMGERRGVYRVLVWKPVGKRPLVGHKHRWENKLRLILRKWDVGVWNVSSWLRIGTGGRHL